MAMVNGLGRGHNTAGGTSTRGKSPPQGGAAHGARAHHRGAHNTAGGPQRGTTHRGGHQHTGLPLQLQDIGYCQYFIAIKGVVKGSWGKYIAQYCRQ